MGCCEYYVRGNLKMQTQRRMFPRENKSMSDEEEKWGAREEGPRQKEEFVSLKGKTVHMTFEVMKLVQNG